MTGSKIKFDRGAFSVQFKMQNFNQNECYENARAVFITCMKYNFKIPPSILDYLNQCFIKEHKKYLAKQNSDVKKTYEKRFRNEALLELAIHADKLVEAYEDFRAVFPETAYTDNNKTLRQSLIRYLDKKINSYLATTIGGEYPYDIPNYDSLKGRLNFYKELLESEEY